MNLRARLILAFVVLSVLPLTAVTVYSYRTSLDALHKTAEAGASAMAAAMTKRMDTVTKDINRELVRLSELPPAPPVPAPAAAAPADSTKSAVAMVTTVLGRSASLLDRLEFVAMPPEPPEPLQGASGSLGPVAGQAAPRLPAAASRQGRITVDVTTLARTLGADQSGSRLTEEELRAQAAALQFVTHLLSAGLKVSSTEAAKKIRAEGSALAEQLAATRQETQELEAMRQPPPPARSRRWTGEAVGVPVRREGHVVGTVNATVNLDRVLGDVLSVTPGDSGEIPFAVDPGRKIYTPRPEDRRRLETVNPAALAAAQPGAHRTGPKADWIVVTRQDPTGVTLGIARPLGEPLREIRRAAGRNFAMGLTLIGLALIGIVPLSGRMTRNLKTLTAGAQRIARGDLQVRVPIRSRDEFGRLAGAFNQMAADLEAHQQVLVTQERLHRELELCRQIQNEMLPHEPLRLDLAEVRGVSIPAREVGGDFFNYFVLSDHEVALLVGDVAGKGVGAALLMANIQATLRARLPLERDLARLADAIDREIERTTPRPVYLTLFVGILDTRGKTLRYVNAGHNPQFILRAEGGVLRLPSTGLPVGMFAGHGYQERVEAISDGDLLFFYTDGMIEVENEKGEFFDIQQLEQLLVAEHCDDIDTLLVRVEQAVHSYRGRAEALDDATMMALRFGSRLQALETPAPGA